MKIIFHWEKIEFDQNQRQFFKDKFKDDFKTLFEKEYLEIHVFMEQYIPGTLVGFITDEATNKLYNYD